IVPVTPVIEKTLPLLTAWLISVAGAPSALSRLENTAGRAVFVSSFCKPVVSSSVTVVPVRVTVSAGARRSSSASSQGREQAVGPVRCEARRRWGNRVKKRGKEGRRGGEELVMGVPRLVAVRPSCA